jgi:hypothetical protein
MSEVLIRHPEEWIGVPEDFPYDRWQSAEDWANDLVAALAEDAPAPSRGQYERLRSELQQLAESREERGAARIYLTLDDWAGPVFVVDLVNLPAELTGPTTIEKLAGDGDSTAVETPILEGFTTDFGVTGVRSIRYVNRDDVGGLLVRADYVFPTSNGFIRLYTAQFDLVDFERVRPLLERLAATIAVID